MKPLPDIGQALKEVMGEMAGRSKGKKAPGAKAKRKRAAKPAQEPRKCGCGCGGMTRGGEFLPGHDMRLKSRLKKAAAEGNEKAKAELRQRGW